MVLWVPPTEEPRISLEYGLSSVKIAVKNLLSNFSNLLSLENILMYANFVYIQKPIYGRFDCHVSIITLTG